MNVLAIELATDVGSLAVLKDGRPTAELKWTEDRLGRSRFFCDVRRLAETGELDLALLDLIAVGVGPGSFSGLRMAVSAACGLALPDRKPVFAVASGEALAWEIAAETGAAEVCVVGDARRNELWIGRFRTVGGWLRMQGAWDVLPFGAVANEAAAEGAIWVTPDWDRIGARLSEVVPAGVRLLAERRAPTARAVGALAARKREAGWPSLPLSPIYVHPAVSVQPRG